MPPVSAVTYAVILSWGFCFSSLCAWWSHQWSANNSLLQQHLDPICLMSTIILSAAYHTYETNYLKLLISESCLKEGRLTHLLFGFYFKSHQDSGYKAGVSSCLLRSFILCLWTNTIVKEEQLPWNNSLFFLFRCLSCDLRLINGTGGV